MKQPLVITPEGKLVSDAEFSLRASLRDLRNWLDKTDLRPTKYLMNQTDYDDIMKWTSGSQ